jgi:hypothetical protein
VSPPTRVHEAIAQAVRCRWHERGDHGGHQVVEHAVACSVQSCEFACVLRSVRSTKVNKSGNLMKQGIKEWLHTSFCCTAAS